MNGRLATAATVVTIVLVLGLTGCVAVPGAMGPTTGSVPGSAISVGCRTVRGPLRVSGTQVLAADDSTVTPYGITVAGLQQAGYASQVSGDLAQITATARDWCANTVRLQLRQANLVGVAPAQAAAFLDAVQREVALAEQNHLLVVLNDQTGTDPGGTDPSGAENGPTPATLAFWRPLVSRYGHDPQVIMDVFNEPRVRTGSGLQDCDAAATWQMWQRGGTTAQGNHSFLGMQQVVDAVRTDGADNLLWVEGPCWAGTLSRVPDYPVTGGPLVYDFHHPSGNAPHTGAEWDADFGYLIDRGVAPVVAGEWTNRSSGNTTNCWADAPTAVPSFLNYLAAHHLGMIAFQLAQGYLIAEPNNFANTTRIVATGPDHWRCDDPKLDQGAGAEIMAWFQQHNQPSGN